MKGESPLSDGERELVLAYALGIEMGLVEAAIEDLAAAPLTAKLEALLNFVRILMLDPGVVTQADAQAVFAEGRDEKALHDAIAITGRAAFMQRIVQGHGFVPLTKEEAARRAAECAQLGYVKIFAEFKDGQE